MQVLALLALALYTVIAVFSVYMTFQERRRAGSAGVVYTLGGYVLCLIWPLTVLAILISPRLRAA
ncbi:hypothetical protein [Pseudotabrizicola formosa]|uniref:hypothetical protein n=1 Tax=Pseudotabrizicola formosa TaxID=2030009 RepID=UPI000CD1E78E|nr:hypothetical protein [Pseudotabrizicola formosa]